MIHELTFDECDELGLDGTGRDLDPNFPYYRVDLDWADEGALTGTFPDYVEGAEGITHAFIIEEHGPAGGWPVVRFVGGIDAIARLLIDYDIDYTLFTDEDNAILEPAGYPVANWPRR